MFNNHHWVHYNPILFIHFLSLISSHLDCTDRNNVAMFVALKMKDMKHIIYDVLSLHLNPVGCWTDFVFVSCIFKWALPLK